MSIHEIGYLVIRGVFQCWFWGDLTSCPNADKIKPGGIGFGEAANFVTEEIEYEVGGFAVFAQKGEFFEVEKKNGERLTISLAELNRETEAALPKNLSAKMIKDSLWRYESIDEILKRPLMLRREGEFLSLLRKDDLKTSLNVSKQVEEVRQARIRKALSEAKLVLPLGYVEAEVSCSYREIDFQTTKGSCSPPTLAPAYDSPGGHSAKVHDVSLIWAQIEGRPVQVAVSSPRKQASQLLVFQIQKDWIQMKVTFGEAAKRLVWMNKKDIPFKVEIFKQEDRLKKLIEFLPSSASSTQVNGALLDSLKSHLESPPELDLEGAGETKWHNGVLWVKVNLRSESNCAIESSKTLATGWLPYIRPGSAKKLLGWYSRGC